MTARSEIDARALAALGVRLRAAGATPAPVATPSTHAQLADGLARLRAALSGRHAPVVDGPTGDGLTPEQARAYAARYKPENARRSLGRTGGYARPQCGGCKAFIKYEGAQCSACGFMDGGGYLAVPAKTSYLERWR